ncbi:hypothetical protein GRAN_2801 [Granulicella sibirica]|uniref:Uncharacterized protein n=1 Tax=Granulicella sibirica TaxID=2479048 RepID=A0A4V1L5J1_9BACT|nr:hypothetical protein GRAN_2801 [Granulicella sibirica]
MSSPRWKMSGSSIPRKADVDTTESGCSLLSRKHRLTCMIACSRCRRQCIRRQPEGRFLRRSPSQSLSRR